MGGALKEPDGLFILKNEGKGFQLGGFSWGMRKTAATHRPEPARRRDHGEGLPCPRGVCARALAKGGALKLRWLGTGGQGVLEGELEEVNTVMHGGPSGTETRMDCTLPV